MDAKDLWATYMVCIAGWLGAVVASYLGVVDDRGWVGSCRGRSLCVCGRILSWWENIPIASWLLLRGRCRCRAERLPGRYLIAECGLGALTAAGASVEGLLGAAAAIAFGGTLILLWGRRGRSVPSTPTCRMRYGCEAVSDGCARAGQPQPVALHVQRVRQMATTAQLVVMEHTTERVTSAPVADSLVAYGTEAGPVRLAHKDSVARAHPGTTALLTREAREEMLDRTLSPGATRSVGAGRRAVDEDPDPWRTCFERDLDRIKHSRPFRRLSGKCQVFLAPDDVHLRNRMTHALEVAQVALAVARRTGLNLALVEAIALGHDCGHGPAGHASEDAFSPYMPGGSYDHAIYGADVTLAPLNLTAEVLDGIRCHSWRLPAPQTPEAEVVSWADRIAYVCHDADDAARSGIIHPSQLPEIVRDRCGTRQSSQLGAFVNAMVEATAQTGTIGMLEDAALALDAFRKFNYDKIYLRPAANRQAERVIAMLSSLVDFFADAPGLMPDVASGKDPFPGSGTPEAVAAAVHYVSGMTDRFALSLAHEKLGWRAEALPQGV